MCEYVFYLRERKSKKYCYVHTFQMQTSGGLIYGSIKKYLDIASFKMSISLLPINFMCKVAFGLFVRLMEINLLCCLYEKTMEMQSLLWSALWELLVF